MMYLLLVLVKPLLFVSPVLEHPVLLGQQLLQDNWGETRMETVCIISEYQQLLQDDLLLTLVSGPLKVDSLGWVKYCRLLFEYFRKVSAVLLARVQALRKASFCSWCLLISWRMRVALSWSPLAWRLSQSSSRLYSRSRLSSTLHT